MFMVFMKNIKYLHNLSSKVPSLKNLKKSNNIILDHLETSKIKNYHETENFWKYKPNLKKNKIMKHYHPLQQFHDRGEGR